MPGSGPGDDRPFPLSAKFGPSINHRNFSRTNRLVPRSSPVEPGANVSPNLEMAEQAVTLMQEKEGSLEAMVRDYARMIYRIAYSVLRHAAEAEDATQEVFLRALRSQKEASSIRDQKAWLARIAWRVAVERKRRVQKDGPESELPQDIPSAACAADEILFQQERNLYLQQLIQTLPPQLRDALVLSALEELSPREVAAMLDISEAAVRSRSFRARQILRERMTARTEGR